jgi:hypothetical protein
MYHRIKNTLASLAVAMTMLGLSYSVGNAPVAQARTVPRVDFASPGIEAGLDHLQAQRKRDRGIQSQLSMPFYSFAPLLPRRES